MLAAAMGVHGLERFGDRVQSAEVVGATELLLACGEGPSTQEQQHEGR